MADQPQSDWRQVLAKELEVMGEPRIRTIDGCKHVLPRMMVYADEGACPICLMAMAAMRGQEVQRLKDALETIGGWAHDRSTGPTVLDDLWEVRRMAYEAMDPPGEQQ